MKFAVIEVGSTNTKGYIYNNGEIEIKSLITIEFKNHYKESNSILGEDKNKLYDYINKIKEDTKDIHIYGTSIFRQLSGDDKEAFLSEFKLKTGYDFNIVSADEENDYTVYGVISNIDYNGKIAVMIGGGGSTELAIVENKMIVEKANSSFGAMDVTHKYPDLKEDKVSSSFKEMLDYTKSLVNIPNNKTDVLVLAGGSYILFYEKLNYQLNMNDLYSDNNQPYILDKVLMDKYDQDFFYNRSLDQVEEESAELKDWWNGTRGMRLCVKALMDILEAKYIIPTDITMVYGIIAKIKAENN